jgi:hypothetical protein
MGYLLRVLRIASYLAAALGLLLIFGAIINNATFFYGIRLLFIGVVGIGATSLLRDRFIESTEEEAYYSLHPPQELIPQVRLPKFIQSIMFKWLVLSPVEKAFLTVILIVGIPMLLFVVISGIGILMLILAMIIEFVFAVM